jgi:hypothetical protein
MYKMQRARSGSVLHGAHPGWLTEEFYIQAHLFSHFSMLVSHTNLHQGQRV